MSEFSSYDISTYSYPVMFIWFLSMLALLELMGWLVLNLPDWMYLGQRLDNPKQYYMSTTGWLYVTINKVSTPIFAYHVLRWTLVSPTLSWGKVTTLNTVLPLLLCILLFDFIYFFFHWGLHAIPVLYRWIHKHHHQIITPSEGIKENLYLHPLEFLPSMYNHLLALFIVSSTLPQGMCHWSVSPLMLSAVNLMGNLNHSSKHLRIPFGLWTWDSTYHERHHALPSCNYAIYTDIFDRFFRTLKEPALESYSTEKRGWFLSSMAGFVCFTFLLDLTRLLCEKL